jgi:hypothetical protein
MHAQLLGDLVAVVIRCPDIAAVELCRFGHARVFITKPFDSTAGPFLTAVDPPGRAHPGSTPGD